MENKKVKVLLVEDSPDNQLIFSTFLKALSLEFTLAENGLEAVEQFSEQLYQLVLMDLNMPIMDGYTAVQKIREIEQNEQRDVSRVVALTALTAQEDLDKAISVGCDQYLTKPLRRQEFQKMVLEAIDQMTQTSASVDSPNTETTSSQHYEVEVESIYEDVMDELIEIKWDQLKKLKSLVDEADFVKLSRLGHTLKGEGLLHPIHEIGKAIEIASKSEDMSSIQLQMQQMEDFLNNMSIRFV